MILLFLPSSSSPSTSSRNSASPSWARMFLLFLAQAVRAAAVEETKHQEVVVEVIVVLLVDTNRTLAPRKLLPLYKISD